MSRGTKFFMVMILAIVMASLIPLPEAKAQSVSPLPGVMPGKHIVVSCGVVYDLDDLNDTGAVDPDPTFAVLPVCGAAIDLFSAVDLDTLVTFQNEGQFLKNASAGLNIKKGNFVLRFSGGVKSFGSNIGDAVINHTNFHSGVAVGITF